MSFFKAWNKIKFLSGQLVEKLTNLETIDLAGNRCIDEVFGNSTSTSIVSKIIDENCGYRNQTAIKKLFDMSCGISLSYREYLLKNKRSYDVPECHGGGYGASTYDDKKWPFLVALLIDTEPKQFFCGASLITSKHILTGNFDHRIQVYQYNYLNTSSCPLHSAERSTSPSSTGDDNCICRSLRFERPWR